MYVMGDIHGQYDKMVAALRAAGLIDEDNHWRGGRGTLWFMGDYFDRGPDGIAVVDLIRALQDEAAAAGGRVGALLGNHDVLILAAHRFGDRRFGDQRFGARAGGPGGSFLASWRANGGEDSDLARLSAAHVAWLRDLPALALSGGRLLAHADATFYQVYGRAVPAVNHAFRALLHSDDPTAWDKLLDYFSQRRAFQDRDLGLKPVRSNCFDQGFLAFERAIEAGWGHAGAGGNLGHGQGAGPALLNLFDHQLDQLFASRVEIGLRPGHASETPHTERWRTI